MHRWTVKLLSLIKMSDKSQGYKWNEQERTIGENGCSVWRSSGEYNAHDDVVPHGEEKYVCDCVGEVVLNKSAFRLIRIVPI